MADFHAAPLPELTRRRTSVPRVPGKADAIVGMRRCGKTYLVRRLIDGEHSRVLVTGSSSRL